MTFTNVPFNTFPFSASNGISWDAVNNYWKNNNTDGYVTVIFSYEILWGAPLVAGTRISRVNCTGYARELAQNNFYQTVGQTICGTTTMLVPSNGTFALQIWQQQKSTQIVNNYVTFVSF